MGFIIKKDNSTRRGEDLRPRRRVAAIAYCINPGSGSTQPGCAGHPVIGSKCRWHATNAPADPTQTDPRQISFAWPAQTPAASDTNDTPDSNNPNNELQET